MFYHIFINYDPEMITAISYRTISTCIIPQEVHLDTMKLWLVISLTFLFCSSWYIPINIKSEKKIKMVRVWYILCIIRFITTCTGVPFIERKIIIVCICLNLFYKTLNLTESGNTLLLLGNEGHSWTRIKTYRTFMNENYDKQNMYKRNQPKNRIFVNKN